FTAPAADLKLLTAPRSCGCLRDLRNTKTLAPPDKSSVGTKSPDAWTSAGKTPNNVTSIE
ncbi:hypothetical protein OFN71_39015, partial [Escherichia coli]|nr:hypothetical protein [Escherichia coli]